MTDFTDNTRKHIDGLPLADRKQLGQYMTPQSLGQLMAQKIVNPPVGSVLLDPAVGTGELLVAAEKTHPNVFVHNGWDVDKNMLPVAVKNLPGAIVDIRSLFEPLPVNLIGSVDYIIGNPPYFELKKDAEELAWCDLVTRHEKGRVNIYALFFEYALKLLKPGGEMIFLVPPSMNNGAYFTLTRKNILENARINSIEVVRENNKFADALTSVQMVHLTRTVDGYEKNLVASDKWVVDFNTLSGVPPVGTENVNRLPVIFSPHKDVIVKAWEGRESLTQLGFNVSTGRQPWNQVKTLFGTTNNHTVPLIYSKDISVDNSLVFTDKLAARRFLPVGFPKTQSGKKIVVNRIIGALDNPRLRYALVDLPVYVTENHVNVIEPGDGAKTSVEELAVRLKSSGSWLPEYLKALTGNTQLSSKELQHLLPL